MCDWTIVVGGESGVQLSILKSILDIQVYMLIRQLGHVTLSHEIMSATVQVLCHVYCYVYYNNSHIVNTQIF